MGAVWLTLSVLCGLTAHATELGATVTNIASISYDDPDRGPITFVTNPAVFVIEAQRTESTIEFFRYAPTTPGANAVNLYGSDYSPSGETDGPFIPENISGYGIDLSNPVPLTPAEAYSTGEIMFVRVTDPGQNGDPNRIETVVVTITTSTGDEIVLRLYESGPDTGEFWAYVPSTREQTPNHDEMLTTGSETTLTATYVDSFDDTEISIDTALVDPYCRVFNALTGDLIDGATVRLIDSRTGQLATVYGIDGVSEYPAEIISGQPVSDASGFVYDIREGEFRFPLIPAGSYHIEVITPEGYRFSSIIEADGFGGLNNAPFEVLPESYGEQFSYDAPQPVHFDIPLDPQTDLILAKTAYPTIVDTGDFITYTVSIQNSGAAPAPVSIYDIAPIGFRYVMNSTRIDGVRLPDPEIAGNGRELSYMIPVVQPGDQLTLTYVMQVGADLREGEYMNSVVAVDRDGSEESNVARAYITVREDLLRSKSTIIGRVAEMACDADEEWAREIVDGRGVEGVRIYLETGAWVVSDKDGLFHFEGVASGTHVVQIDEETLPQGYTPMQCEENTQYADADMSKFVDVKGGGIWRANFYLQRNNEEIIDDTEKAFSDVTEYKAYDEAWLNEQSAEAEWVYPKEGMTPSTPSVNIGIKHGPKQRASLILNGEAVPMTNFHSRDASKDRSVMLSRWKGVDVLDGKNVFIVEIKDTDGNVQQTLRREIHYVTKVSNIVPVEVESVLIADGRTAPVIALRVTDDAGRAVHGGRALDVQVSAPYQFEITDSLENSTELVAPLAAEAAASVGADGIARVRLEPTLQTGQVHLVVKTDDEREIDVHMYLQPESRDWIVVGLAEAEIGVKDVNGNGIDLDDDGEFTDGRLAFFAKGMIKGDWLLTLAVDTDKRPSDRRDLFGQIDPNKYYTLYGDETYQNQEAASIYPIFVKLEKNTFSAMFGDYDTNLTNTELTRYSRRMSGLKSEYVGETFDFTAFAAETDQGFALDEIPADGTSGPYRTRFAPIVANSEVIEIETRDRTRPDVVISRRLLTRHADYTIDYLTGDIVFRLPVNVTDGALNPNVIVVDYETNLRAERNVTYGGRVAAKLGEGKAIVGASYIHEEGRADAPRAKTDLLGVDAVVNLTENTQLRVEYAVSDTQTTSEDISATAWMAEVLHQSEKLSGELYIRREEEGFGTGQQRSSTAGRLRYGASAAYKLSESIDEETGRRVRRHIKGQAYHEESLLNGASRDLAEITASHESEKFSLSAGLRSVQEDLGTEQRESVLALVSGHYRLAEHGLTLTAAHEQPINGDDESTLFPGRTVLGVDKTLTESASVSLRHEILRGQNADANNTVLGVSWAPWAGTEINASTDVLTQDSAQRLGATVGVDQQWKLSDKWSASVGASQRKVLSQTGDPQFVTPDAAFGANDINEDYRTGYIGLGYRTDVVSASGRIEARQSDSFDTVVGTVGIARELSEEFSLATLGRVQKRYEDIGGDEMRADLRIAGAWRPRGEGTVVFDRLDLKFDERADGTKTRKLVNNLAMNTMVTDRWQLTTNYGVKYTDITLAGDDYSSWTHLLGAETRYDITPRIDIGLHGSVLMTDGGSARSYSWGPSIGFSPVDNSWISLGYNVQGFKDDDFEAAEYAEEGFYLKVRLKFDQDSLDSLLTRISPKSD